MKKHLVIIGGGVAGFWSAMSAVRQSREIQKKNELEITLINPGNRINMRPTLNHVLAEGPRIELSKYLQPLGVHQITGRVEAVQSSKNELTLATAQGVSQLHYDVLILATGVSLQPPALPGMHHTFNLDSYHHAQRLEDHFFELARTDFSDEGAATFVVVGSGVEGLQTVVALGQRLRTIHAYHSNKATAVRVMLLESDEKYELVFSKACTQYIYGVLASKNIDVLPSQRVASIDATSLRLVSGARIPTRTVIWTRDLMASPLTHHFQGAQDERNRLVLDQYLRLPEHANVLAAGNIARIKSTLDHAFLVPGRYAQFEGRWAGHNAVNTLFALPLKEYMLPGYELCVDVGEPDTAYTTEQERDLQQQRDREREAKRRMNTVSLYPWQDVEQTVKASQPALPKY